MNRRQFLKVAALMTAGSGMVACSPLIVPESARLNNETLLTTARQQAALPTLSPAVHMLRRITYGPRPGEVARVEAIGHEAFIEAQLAYEQLDTSRAEAIEDSFETLDTPPGDLRLLGRLATGYEVAAATIARMLYSEQQLYEVMVEFWSNHFNIFLLKKITRILKAANDRDVVRPHALGRFRDLLHASAHSPAMLFYLDNHTNEKSAPNENYARELLELHTLGVDGGYTQQDVMDVARAFTGWSIGGRQTDAPGEFLFKAELHDNGPKTVLGHPLPANGGQADGEIVLDILASHPSTARHISRKLCVRFISDDPPAAVVEAAALRFRQTDGDIKSVLRTILSSEAFWAATGQKIKRPLEFVTSTLRTLDIQPQRLRPVLRASRTLGQAPFMWSAPDGYPDESAAWINTNSLLSRWNLVLDVTQHRLVRRHLLAPLERLDPREPGAIVDLYAGLILHHRLPTKIRAALVKLLHEDVAANVPTVVGLLLASPYFQYR